MNYHKAAYISQLEINANHWRKLYINVDFNIWNMLTDTNNIIDDKCGCGEIYDQLSNYDFKTTD